MKEKAWYPKALACCCIALGVFCSVLLLFATRENEESRTFWFFFLEIVSASLGLVFCLNRKARIEKTRHTRDTKIAAYCCSVFGVSLLVLPCSTLLWTDDFVFIIFGFGMVLASISLVFISIGRRKYGSLIRSGIKPTWVWMIMDAINIITMSIDIIIILVTMLFLILAFFPVIGVPVLLVIIFFVLRSMSRKKATNPGAPDTEEIDAEKKDVVEMEGVELPAVEEGTVESDCPSDPL